VKKYPGIRRVGPNRYRVRVTTNCPLTGKRREVDRLVECASLSEAAQMQMQLRSELEAAEPTTARVKLRDYATKWLERRKPRLKHSTQLRYAEHLDRIIEGLGDVYMDKLNPGIVTDWLTGQAATLSGWTCHGMLRVLRTMTRDAQVELGLLRWPCERVGPPKSLPQYDDENPNALSAEELGRLFVAMRETEPYWYPLFATMALTGLRFAEASSLQWCDVDEERGVIRVRRSQYRGVVGEPKTVTSRRPLPLVPELASVLKEHRAALVRGQHPGLVAGWVFPSAVGGLLSTGVLKNPLRRACVTAGITTRLTPQGLRRTLNTLALQVASGETARAILGHATAAMTAHYNAPAMDAKRAALGRVVALVGPSAATGSHSVNTTNVGIQVGIGVAEGGETEPKCSYAQQESNLRPTA
jgi:integrase